MVTLIWPLLQTPEPQRNGCGNSDIKDTDGLVEREFWGLVEYVTSDRETEFVLKHFAFIEIGHVPKRA